MHDSYSFFQTLMSVHVIAVAVTKSVPTPLVATTVPATLVMKWGMIPKLALVRDLIL